MDHDKYDLIDVEHKIVCSSCDAPLANILVTRDSGRTEHIVIHCPHCGDKSFKKRIVGEYYLVPTPFTSVIDIQYINDITVMLTLKTKDWK